MTAQVESLAPPAGNRVATADRPVPSVLFLIRSLHVGGAERQVVTLAKALQRRGRRVHVATFYPGGDLFPELAGAGVPVTSLAKRGRWDLLAFSYRLVRLIRRERPAALYPWLPDPNLLTAVLRPLLGELRLVWGVGASYVDLSQYDWAARVSDRIAGYLSRRADVIIANSRAGERYHRDRGYPGDRIRVVPNGIDTEYFRPDPVGRARVRDEFDIRPETPLIGAVARLDPMKDYHTFLDAAAHLARRRPDVRFVCVGGGSEAYVRDLHERARTLGLDDRLHWAGTRADMPAVYSALEVSTLTSIGEGFPNVVAEAMACGTRCVVTDVGDSAWIVGSLGETVPPRQPVALAAAWERAIADGRSDSPARRERIVREFGVERLVADTERLLWGL